MLKQNNIERKKNNNLKVKQILSNDTKSIATVCNPNYLEKYNKKKLKVQKYLILLACAFLDFSKKFLTFFLKKLVINNIWIFNIFFISIFDYLILKAKLYRHQYISCAIIIVIGIVAITIGLLKETGNILIKLLICIGLKIIYSLSIVLRKFLMDHRSCSPFEVTFYEGTFVLIANSILLVIFTNVPITDENGKLGEILSLTKYNENIYIDHFFAAFKDMKVGEVFLFILSYTNYYALIQIN